MITLGLSDPGMGGGLYRFGDAVVYERWTVVTPWFASGACTRLDGPGGENTFSQLNPDAQPSLNASRAARQGHRRTSSKRGASARQYVRRDR
jgi:hypothetical protein